MAAMTIQAPWMNFVCITTIRTRPVARAPIALMIALRRHPFACVPPRSRTRCQCRTIPDCDSVKLVNTPTT